MSKILAVANIKGGVGKTTTVVNLAAALAEQNYRVLAIDLDPQSSLTLSLGMKPEKISVTIRQMLEGHSDILWPIHQTSEQWDVIPGNVELRVLEHELETAPHRIPKVALGLQPLREKYDYVLLDCPATTGPLIGAALAAADQVVIPLTPDYLAFQVSRTLFRIIHTIQRNMNPRLRVAGIFLTMYDARTRYARDLMTKIRESYQDVPFFSAVVQQSVKVKEAPAFGQSVLRYAPESQAAKAYRVIADEIIHGIPGPREKTGVVGDALGQAAVPIVVMSETASEQAPWPIAPRMHAAKPPAPVLSVPSFLVNPPSRPNHASSEMPEMNPPHVAQNIAPARTMEAPSQFIVTTTVVAEPELLSPAQEILACMRAFESNQDDDAENELNLKLDEFLLLSTQSDLDELYQVAEGLRERGYEAHAARIYQHMTRLDEACALGWLGLARVSGDPLERLAHCQKAHQLNPTRETRSELKLAQLRLQEQAYRLLEENENNSDPDRMRHAHRLFRQAAELDPSDDRVWLGCARSTDNLIDKINFLKHALKLNPQNKQAYELAQILGAFAITEPGERWAAHLQPKRSVLFGLALFLLFAVVFIVPQFLYAR